MISFKMVRVRVVAGKTRDKTAKESEDNRKEMLIKHHIRDAIPIWIGPKVAVK